MCISYGHDHDTTDVLDFGDQYRTTPVILEGYRNRLSTSYARTNYLSPTIFRRSLHCQLHACGDVESVDSTAIYESLVYMAIFVFSKWLIFDAGRVVVTETCYSRVAIVNPKSSSTFSVDSPCPRSFPNHLENQNSKGSSNHPLAPGLLH